MSKLLLQILQKLSHRYFCDPCSFSLLPEAASYYLPEGRYYAAPSVLKRRRKNRYIIPTFLGIGLLIVNISSLQPTGSLPLIAVNTTVLIRSTDLHPSAMPVAVNPALSRSTSSRAKNTDIRKTHHTAHNSKNITVRLLEEINRKEKTAAVILRKTNNRSRLTSYKTDRKFVSTLWKLQDITAQEYVSALVIPEETRAKLWVNHMPVHAPVPQKKEYPKLPVPEILSSLVTNEKPDILALGYTSVTEKKTPFDGILHNEKRKKVGRFIPPVGFGDHEWVASPVPGSTFSPTQQKCLAEAVYFEARGESLKGQAAVAQVVLNRVRNPAYPDTVCGVVYQNVQLHNRCQFSFACNGKLLHVTELHHWRIAQDIAKAVSAGQIWLAEIGSSTHYHAIYVRPDWSGSMDKMQKIGQHVFYRTRGGGWS